MARKPDETAREQKRAFIIERARGVFCRKGYLTVTMADIIEACGISRGGIYLYFSSVREIFMAVIATRNRTRFESIRGQAEENTDFWLLVGSYFATQRERLLNMEHSILRATYEFYHKHQTPEDLEFRSSQVQAVRQTILAILELGVGQGAIRKDNIATLADTIVYLVEGLSVFGVYGSLTAASLDGQIALLTGLLERERVNP